MPRLLALLLLLPACAPALIDEEPPPVVEPVPIATEPQLQGDPAVGWDFLVNGDYIGCGLPEPLFRLAFNNVAEELRLPGRNADNEDVPYFFNVFTTVRGNKVAHPNCLSCHAATLGGQLVVGLGAHDSDFTTDNTANAAQGRFLLSEPGDVEEFELWFERAQTVAPYILTRTVGTNPADALAPALASHRDPETLAWSDGQLFPYEPQEPLPVDVPPWWRAAKKNALYATGGGRGDHARLMMQASTMCVDSLEEAQRVADLFDDVRAWILTVEAPTWPYDVDADLARAGGDVFEARCARCHGRPDGSYPNLFVPLELVETDAALATSYVSGTASGYIEWFENSFYGETARLEPGVGYMAPPLDGIWATAPFLHNGSVPTLEALLDSSLRPARWRRANDRGDGGYDAGAVGWHHDVVDAVAEGDTSVYDTTRAGFSNAGHVFGDELSADERRALLELLKTF